ncbi:MAG: asparagine synthase-related protein [Vicinamibacterales bacterium]
MARCEGNVISHKILPQPGEFVEDLEDFVRTMEEPIISSGPYAQYQVMREASKHVTVLLDGQGAEQFEIGPREVGELASRLARAVGLDGGEELGGEQLREQQEVRLVVRGHVDEELALPGEFLERGDRAHLVLDRRQLHRAGRAQQRPAMRLHVVQVGPLQERREAARLGVGREVVGDEALQHEAVRELGREHRVEQFLADHLGHVLRGRHLGCVAAVARDSSANHDALEVPVLCQ